MEKRLINKIKKYAKLRGGKSYNEADPEKLIRAFENATAEWQKVYEEGMDIYLHSIKTGRVRAGESMGK